MVYIKEQEGGVVFKVRVQPRASKNQVSGVLDDAVKIRLTAPPVDGEANKVLCQYLAKIFKVAKKQVQIVSGHTSRSKLVCLENVSAEQVKNVLGIE
ncbi:MAG: YggU family protein [Desulfotomaculum sp.]|nr:YggU family protein [Desulfotomaculum sp.]